MNNALIWGASGGIGSAIGRRLILEKWHVFGAVRKAENFKDGMVGIEAELGNYYSVQAVVTNLAQEIEQIDWWIYAAGDIASMSVSVMDEKTLERIMDANLNGVIHAIRASQALLSTEAPLYILGARQERLRLPGLAAYAAAKAGVEALAEVLKKELRRTVVVVRPSAVNTAFWHKTPFKMPANAISADELAEKVWHAYQQKYSDLLLDL
jgi:NADP-dependent 3-hydroxy acid dehydrogenase YdfG